MDQLKKMKHDVFEGKIGHFDDDIELEKREERLTVGSKGIIYQRDGASSMEKYEFVVMQDHTQKCTIAGRRKPSKPRAPRRPIPWTMTSRPWRRA